jgi:hypothetical protein
VRDQAGNGSFVAQSASVLAESAWLRLDTEIERVDEVLESIAWSVTHREVQA